MDYENFCKILTGKFSELPINRKEKFYTGTVLPALLFHNGFSNLYHFLREINNFQDDEINEQKTGDKFLFYTEYNLKQSAGKKKNVGREIPTETNDTPDIVIEMLSNPKRVFVIIEAKMFRNIYQSSLSSQMSKQKTAVIEPLKKAFQLKDNHIFHIALVPEKSGLKDGMEYQVINWEYFIDNRDLNVKDNIFYNYLRFALDNYEDLVENKSGKAETVKDYKTVEEIYRNGKNNGNWWVGRQGGEKTIIEDIKTNWKNHNKKYAMNTIKPSRGRNGNWITSKKFAELVDEYGKG
jgi:hypothetical protein